MPFPTIKVAPRGDNRRASQDVFGRRAVMRVPPGGGVSGSSAASAASAAVENARLSIERVSEADGGRYRCRADFKKSPTKNYGLQLTVLSECIPPLDFWEVTTSVAGQRQP